MCARVEQAFGAQAVMGGHPVRTIGLVRDIPLQSALPAFYVIIASVLFLNEPW
ncbi:MAG: hypothetical protein WAW61_21075 [Methylococcaceae bacterium]